MCAANSGSEQFCVRAQRWASADFLIWWLVVGAIFDFWFALSCTTVYEIYV
jgi:hypothetical protein